jgi:uncharacterized protein (TIGR00299 family) protein
MRILHFDCGMGAAGDMLTAALVELFDDPAAIVRELNDLGIPGVRFCMDTTQKCGITGTHMHVFVWDVEEHEHMHDHEHGHNHEHTHTHSHHHHSGMEDIAHIISHLRISEKVRADVLAVYDLIAQAESHAHGVAVEQIHFHEVGTMDAIADVTAVCYLIDKLNMDKITATPIHVGSGQVKCAHGILPVPAPATAHILRGVPTYGGEIRGELCTPTGAALLKHFVAQFGKQEVMATEKIGYGMGKKDFPAANCVRAMLGSTNENTDSIAELSCNLDDMTGEEIGFAMERLLEAGALDVYTTSIGMKKNRPGILLTVLCRPADKDTMVHLLFRHTTTLGIRENSFHRYTLARRTEIVESTYGPVRKKISSGYGVERCKLEYEDLKRISSEQNISLRELLSEIE